jgi:hypothetical protein
MWFRRFFTILLFACGFLVTLFFKSPAQTDRIRDSLQAIELNKLAQEAGKNGEVEKALGLFQQNLALRKKYSVKNTFAWQAAIWG